MKKIVSLFLCIIMLLGVMSISAFAKEYYAGPAATTAPIIDGAISEGEYSWTSGVLNNKGEEANRVILGKGVTSATAIQFYLSYDKDYIYVAYAEVGADISVVWLDFNPKAGFSDSTGQVYLYTKVEKGDIKSSSVNERTAEAGNNKTSDYLVEQKSSAIGDDVNVNVYEAKLKRSAFEKYAGKSFEKLGFRAFNQVPAGNAEIIFYADSASGIKPAWFKLDVTYHVINLNNNGTNPVEKDMVTIDSFEKKEVDENHVHSFGDWKRSGQTHHKRTCECGEIEYDFHAWGEGEVTREATAEKDGQIKYTCTICSTTTKDDIPFGVTVDLTPETEAPVVDDPATEAPATEAPETEAPVAEGGCGSAIAAVGVALVTALGTCTVFINKKR